MEYVVLARRWRPQTFEEIVGQKHITRTLTNALSKGRISHAYLFTGPRGVGKTTTARILAKSLNCQKGPTPQPCNQCTNCQEITEGRNMDVLEIDGASNRGIEEIRNLRSNVKFAPAKSKFKIYIIDEVHMLTPEAFNALLKTLEEPPPHIRFIFATTQPHKIPSTVISRCQRFDFRRLSITEIAERIKDIVQAEGFKISEEALFAIARAGEGSMRDSQGILDQLLSFSQGEISLKDVYTILGMVEEEIYYNMAYALVRKDTLATLELVDTLAREGKDLHQFLKGLTQYFRNLLLIKIGGKASELIDLPPTSIHKLKPLAQEFSQEELLKYLEELRLTEEEVRRSSSTRIPLEITLIKLSQGEERKATAPAAPPLEKEEKAERKDKGEKEPPLLEEEPLSGGNSEAVEKIWPEVMERIKQRRKNLYALLSLGQPVSIKGNVLTVRFKEKNNFFQSQLERNLKVIEEVLKEVLNREMKISGEFTEGKKPSPRPQKSMNEIPLLKSALEIFEGEIVKVTNKKGGS